MNARAWDGRGRWGQAGMTTVEMAVEGAGSKRIDRLDRDRIGRSSLQFLNDAFVEGAK